MTIQAYLLHSPTPRNYKKGPRLDFTATSGADVLVVSYPAGDKVPEPGKQVLVEGFYMPARQAGDLPRLWVR